MPVRLFVGNLSYEATEAELRQHFSTIGPVSYCYLPTDRETGRPRGFAFVEYTDDSLANQAIDRLNNQPFRGRPLAVKEAQPREARPPGGAPMGTRPAFGPGPRPPRTMGSGGAPSFDAPVRRAPGSNFGPDAPRRERKASSIGRSPEGRRGPFASSRTAASTAPTNTARRRMKPSSKTISPPASSRATTPRSSDPLPPQALRRFPRHIKSRRPSCEAAPH